MAYFLYQLNPPRPTFMTDMTSEEAAMMGRHAEYWMGFIDKGIVVAFGPVADPTGGWGLGLVEVSDLPEIEALAASDPAITAGAGFTCDILPMPHGIMGRAAREH